MTKYIKVMQLGLIDYAGAYSFQKELVDKRLRQEVPDTLILLEHEPVFTVGRGGSVGNILVQEFQSPSPNTLSSKSPLPRGERNKVRGYLVLSDEKCLKEKILLYEIDRGGDVTYHGPGQLVGYPILDLNGYGRDIHKFIRCLEEVIIKTLVEYGLPACRIPGFTGVWVRQKKVASIGVGVRKWVSFHGFSLNVVPEMKYFSFINPCGLKSEEMTSMQELLKKKLSISDVEQRLIKHFSEVFRVSCRGSIHRTRRPSKLEMEFLSGSATTGVINAAPTSI